MSPRNSILPASIPTLKYAIPHRNASTCWFRSSRPGPQTAASKSHPRRSGPRWAGFIEETGAAQHYRDCRITPIYEGTNGIQALDLVGRKIMRDRGEELNKLIAEIRDTEIPDQLIAGAMWSALDLLRPPATG